MSLDEPTPEMIDSERLLSGKRRTPRRRRSIAVRCIGPAGKWYAGRTVDVSRGGMLVEITDPEFMPLGESGDLIPFAARVALQFPQGMDVNFGDGAVQVHASVVRLVSKSGGSPLVLLGCRFDPELTDFDCRLLGLDVGGDETSLPTPHAPPRPVREAVAGDANPAPAPARELEAYEIDEWDAEEALPSATEIAPAAAAQPPDIDARPTLAPAKPVPPPREAAAAGNGPAASPASPPSRPGSRRRARPESAKGLLRGMDELRVLIGEEESRWRNEEGPTAKARVVKFQPPTAEEDADDEDDDDELFSRLSAGPRQPPAKEWTASGDIVVHMFPANAPLHGPRFSGRLVALRGRSACVEMPAPEGENDPASWAAALGCSARLVCLRDGRVLWDVRARVDGVEPGAERGWARAVLAAVHPPPPHARRALGQAVVA